MTALVLLLLAACAVVYWAENPRRPFGLSKRASRPADDQIGRRRKRSPHRAVDCSACFVAYGPDFEAILSRLDPDQPRS